MRREKRDGHAGPDPREQEPGSVEFITTCSCGHALSDHAHDGCVIVDCECDTDRGLLFVGKVKAVDEM